MVESHTANEELSWDFPQNPTHESSTNSLPANKGKIKRKKKMLAHDNCQNIVAVEEC